MDNGIMLETNSRYSVNISASYYFRFRPDAMIRRLQPDVILLPLCLSDRFKQKYTISKTLVKYDEWKK